MTSASPNLPPAMHPKPDKKRCRVVRLRNGWDDVDDLVTKGSLEVVVTSFKKERRPALLFNAASRLVENLDERREDVIDADEKFQQLDTARELAKIEGYKMPNGPTLEHKLKQISLNRERKDALNVLNHCKKQLEELEKAVREAAANHYRVLRDIQDVCVQAFEQAGLIKSDTSEPLNQNDPPHTPPHEKTPTTPVAPAPQAPPSPPKVPIDRNFDTIGNMVKAEERLRREQEVLSRARNNIEEHRETYRTQVQDYAHYEREHVNRVESEFGPIFANRFIRLSKNIDSAEKAAREAQKAAQAAGVPNTWDEESMFALDHDSHVDDIYQQRCIKTTNHKRMKMWCDATNQARGWKPEEEGSYQHSASPDVDITDPGHLKSRSSEVKEPKFDTSDIKGSHGDTHHRREFSGGHQGTESLQHSMLQSKQLKVQDTIGDRNLDPDEKMFQFTFGDIIMPGDSGSHIEDDPKTRKKIEQLKKRGRNHRSLREKRSKIYKRPRRHSIDIYQAIPKPQDNPGFAGDRSAYTPIWEHTHESQTGKVVIQALTNSWGLSPFTGEYDEY